MTEAEAAWLAGLFEGEGCIRTSLRDSYLCSPVLTIVMTDRDVLERVSRLTHGRGIHERKRQQPHHKTSWYWLASGRDAIAIMNQIYPWLGERRRARWDELYGEYRAYKDRLMAPRKCANPECGTIFTPRAQGGKAEKWCTPRCARKTPDFLSRERERNNARYANDPEYRERKKRLARARHARLVDVD